ncbi:serine protease [Prevotella melaninogenica]|uniref:tetratricopeptide repeat protein n=1 Tax=Prevotella TaxID=838 RepID=UPI0003ACF715|nr:MULTISPECIES: tetratricopeptide repeat protein [Prevotella]ERJ75098.1 tetratricopeptide repeat protein [Prevotella sp. F0091]QUB73591.1 serine protease [Prevotella melaninogenica]
MKERMNMKLRTLILTIALVLGISTNISAQPGAVKKAADAAFILTTFKADGSILATSNGVCISTDGIAISPWKPFIGADKAVIIDAKGQKHEVECLLGANEIYDIVKFQVNGKTIAAPLTTTVSANDEVWITPMPKSGNAEKADVVNVEKFMDKYNYAILKSTATDKLNGAPVFNTKGQVIGLFNISGDSQSSTDVNYANDFTVNGLSQNDITLRQSGICIGLPNKIEEAVVALMLSSEKPSNIHEAVVNDFIAKFPQSNDGYYALANIQIAKGEIANADKTMQTAVRKVTAKDEAHYNYARLIYRGTLAQDSEEKTKSVGWTLDKALDEIQKAQSTKANDAYRHLQAQIIFAKGDYAKAYTEFEALTKTKFNNPELYLEMAQSRQHLGATDQEILDLLNKSIELCDTPYVSTSAPYFYTRGQQLEKMGEFRKAVQDYYTYEYFNQGRLGAAFYYMREQCEVKARMWQQALQDILIASRLDPKEALYPTEAGSLLLRLNKIDAAISAAQQAIQLDASLPDAYLILGIAQCESKQKEEGLKNIQKAKELGNTQADTFLQKYKVGSINPH